MPARASGEYYLPRLIICEGPDDVVFIKKFINARKLPECHIRHTGQRLDNVGARGGVSKIGDFLQAQPGARSFRSAIRQILIFVDNDLDPTGRFEEVRNQIHSAGYEPPGALGVWVNSNGKSLAVVGVPPVGPGHLESLCLPAAKQANPQVAAHAEHFAKQVTDQNWTQLQIDKLVLRAILSGKVARDPFVHLGECLERHPTIIDLLDRSLDQLANLFHELFVPREPAQ